MSAPGSMQERVRPVVDPARGEAAGACVRVRPHNVAEVVRMSAETFGARQLVPKLKAATPNADACAMCGLRVRSCPEQAITLQHQAHSE